MQTRTNILYGLLAVIVAAVFVVQQLGVLPPYISDMVTRSLPVVLVVIGLSVLLRNRVPLGGFIALVLGVALVAGISTTAYSLRQSQIRDENQITHTEEIGASVSLLRVRVQSLNTDVEVVRAPASSQRTITAAFSGSTESNLTENYIEGVDGSATFNVTESRQNPFPVLEAVGRGTLLVELPPDVPLDVQVEADDGQLSVNLTDTQLERLNLDLSAGGALVTLPDYAPQFSQPEESLGTWRVASGSMTVRVPENVSARFDMSESTGGDPDYDPSVYNLLFGGNVLEARNIDTAEIVVRYDLVVQRNRLDVTVLE